MASGPPDAGAVASFEPIEKPDRHGREGEEHEGDEEVEQEGLTRRAASLAGAEHEIVQADDRDQRRHLHQHQPIVAEARQSVRSEEHTSELQSLMRISYAVFCLKKKNN